MLEKNQLKIHNLYYIYFSNVILKSFQPHILLLPSKENINPDLPLDEQTDALPYDRKWEFPVRDLTLGPLLGQGAFGKVLKAEAKNIERRRFVSTVAVKTVKGEHADNILP